MNHEEFLKSVNRWDEHTFDTPTRAVQAWKDMTAGYYIDLEKEITVFPSAEYASPVGMHKIEFSSLCEHHMLPFIGEATVVYIPHKEIVGLSKLPRIVDCFSRRLQTQERLTKQIADYLYQQIQAAGVFVKLDCWHSCVSCRGILSRNSSTVTAYGRGALDASQAQLEVCSLLFGNK
jgi:GTP cyclohydrolase I